MSHHLLLCLGAGPFRKGEYKPTTYFRPERPETAATTPFVGEAILSLYPDTFSHVHIFGTAGSMWHTLYERTTEGDSSPEAVEAWQRIANAVETGTLEPGHPCLEILEQQLIGYFGIQTSIHLVPLPKSEAATWAMLQDMADVGLRDGDTISIDISHGLRVQPLFLLLAARYLQAVHTGLELQHVFYGALDLQEERGAPLYDLRVHVALLDWIDAARAFDRYGDAGLVAGLLEKPHGDPFAAFARTLQINTLYDVADDARELVRRYEQPPAWAPVPFKLLLPRLLNLPRRLAASSSSWETKLLLAERQAKAHNYGLAVLAAWEAILDRVAQAYGLSVNERRTRGVYKALSRIATADVKLAQYQKIRDFYSGALPRFRTKVHLGLWKRSGNHRYVEPAFGLVVATLQKIRNAIAHADEGLDGSGSEDEDGGMDSFFEARHVHALIEDGLLAYLWQVLSSPAFDRLAQVYPRGLNTFGG